MKVLKTIAALAIVLFLTPTVWGQTCTLPFTLRQETCPTGSSTCTTKTTNPLDHLTYQEMDRDIMNTILLCNGVGRYTWPAPAAGVPRSNGSGVITLGTAAGTGSCTNQLVSALNDGAAPTCASVTSAMITDATIVSGDLANDAVTYGKFQNVTSGKLLGRSTAGAGDAEEITVGTNLTLSGGTLSASGGGGSDPLAVMTLIEEFVGGSTEAGEIGELGWSASGTIAYLAGEANHPGIVRLTTAATSGSGQLFYPATVTTTQILATDIGEAAFVFRLGTVTAVSFNCGFMADHSNATSGGTESVRLNFDSSASPNFRTVTKNGGGTTTNVSGTAGAANTWYYGRIVRNGSGNFEFYVNGSLLGTNTTNLATGALGFSCNATPLENVAKTWDLDYIKMTTKTLGQRW